MTPPAIPAHSAQNADRFDAALKAFVQDVDDDVIEDFKTVTSSVTLIQAIKKIQQDQARGSGLRAMSKVWPFVECLQQYAGVIETCVQIYPEALAAIWGPVKFLLQASQCIPQLDSVYAWRANIATNYHRAFDDVASTFADIGNNLPVFQEFAQLFSNSPTISSLLQLFYKDILDFYSVLIKFFRIKGWKVFYELLWPRYSKKINVIRRNIADHKALMNDQVTLEELRNAKERSERALYEYERNEQADQKTAFQHCREALSPPMYDIKFQDIEKELAVDTCRWVTHDSVYRSWIRSQAPSTSVLWLCGIPGAGKTHISARVIESLRRAGNSVLFAFLNWQEEDVTWTEVLHSLIFQLVYTDSQLRPILVQEFEDNFRDLQASAPFNEKLLQDLLACSGPCFIVADGLDEINSKARKDVLKGLVDLVGRCDGLRVLCSSREEYDISSTMKSAALTLRVENKNANDIRNFCEYEIKKWLDELEENDELDEERRLEIESLTLGVSSMAQGMFLYVKLVIEHIKKQPDVESIRVEAQNPPKDLGEIYHRILQRYSKLSENEFRFAQLILCWIGCSKTPLRKEELLQILTIDDATMDVDPRRRPLKKKDLRYFCGPIIEEKGEFVSFVHFTAKEHIFSPPTSNMQPWLSFPQANLNVARACLTYLMMPEINLTTSGDELLHSIATGRFVVLTYVLANWLDHLTHAYSLLNDAPSINSITEMVRRVLQSKKRHPPPSKTDQKLKPGSVPAAFEAFKHMYPNDYEDIARVIMDESSDSKATEHLLILQEFWERFRTEYHNLICSGPNHRKSCHCSILESYYGSRLYKCGNLRCVFARRGWQTQIALDRHARLHDWKFRCPLPECKWRAPFASQKQLEQHTTLFHLGQTSLSSGSGSSITLEADMMVLEQMLVDSIEHSDLGTLQAVSQKFRRLPVDYLMVLAYLKGAEAPVLNFLLGQGAAIENLEVIQSLRALGSMPADLGFPYVCRDLDHVFQECFLHLHPPVSALTVATSVGAAGVVDWLLGRGMSVTEQKTSLYNSRPLDHLFALQLARYKNTTAGARQPLNVDVVRILTEAGAPVHPGQALVDLCQTPFVSRIAAEDEAWTRAAELMVEKGAQFPRDPEVFIKAQSRSKRLLTLAADHARV